MRSKEDAQDYRYFPDPDLLPLEIPKAWIDAVAAAMPSLPAERRRRYREAFALPAYDAALLAESREKADYFEAVLDSAGNREKLRRVAANWVNGEVSALLNERALDFARCPIAPATLARLLERVDDGTISAKAAKELLAELGAEPGAVDALIESRGLRQISDTGALEAAVDQVIAGQPRYVEDYRSGKEKAFNALVGQVMKATQGKANPQEVSRLLRTRLDG
jgi:aspartyl-tRNA(Asn)/glutamyl-tRNA(Gln) amidotransferase subunit B